MLFVLISHTICSILSKRREPQDEITFSDDCQGHHLELYDNTPKTLSMRKNKFYCIDSRDSVIYAFGKRLRFEGINSYGFTIDPIEAFGSTLLSTKVTSLTNDKVTFIKLHYPYLESGQTLFHVLSSKWNGNIDSFYNFKRDDTEIEEKIIQVINPLMSTVTVTSKDKVIIENDNHNEKSSRGKKKGKFITISVLPKALTDGRKTLRGKYKVKAKISVQKVKTLKYYPEKIIKIEKNKIYPKNYKSDEIVTSHKIRSFFKMLLIIFVLYIGSFILYAAFAEPHENEFIDKVFEPIVTIVAIIFSLIFIEGLKILPEAIIKGNEKRRKMG